MKVLHENEERVILRMKDGTVVHVFEDAMRFTNIPKRGRQVKYMEYEDLYVINDAFKTIYPECQCNGRTKITCD